MLYNSKFFKKICSTVFVKSLSLTCQVSMKTDKEPHLLKSRQVGKCRPREIRPDISQGHICFVTGNLRPDVSGYSGIPCALHLWHARQSLNLGLNISDVLLYTAMLFRLSEKIMTRKKPE